MADDPRFENDSHAHDGRFDMQRAALHDSAGLDAGAPSGLGASMPAVDAGTAVLIEDPAEPASLMDIITRDRRVSIAVIVALVAVALLSAFPVRDYFAAPDTYDDVVAVLDEKKANVMGLVAASTAASAGITLIPDDVGTPIADKLMDLSGNLMIILAVIYLEKYMLTIFGFAAFGVLFPLALAMIAGSIAAHRRLGLSVMLQRVAAKMIALGLVIMLVVPVSVFVTQKIDATYDMSTEIAASQRQQEDEAAAAEAEEDEPSNPIEFIQSIPDMIADGVTSVSDDVLYEVNSLIEQAAVMIVTSCLIPLLVLAFFLWMANLLLGINIDAPVQALMARAQRVKPTREDIAPAKKRLAERRAQKKAAGANKRPKS